jgi:hypothetical protein
MQLFLLFSIHTSALEGEAKQKIEALKLILRKKVRPQTVEELKGAVGNYLMNPSLCPCTVHFTISTYSSSGTVPHLLTIYPVQTS